jgi:Zn-dependent peptidase ImmA (M78 family)/transcriptional regulator with XRE-family HTH domain
MIRALCYSAVMVEAASDVCAVPTALESVRLARGLTQSQLAARAQVSQAVLSKAEGGSAALSGARLAQVAAALECPVELLTDPTLSLASNTACVFHRKRASTNVGQAKQARALLALAREHASALLDLAGVAAVRLPRMSPTPDDYVSPEDIAQQVRLALGLAAGPVPDLVAALEGAGAVVMATNLGGRKLDALSDWPAGGRPVLLVNAAAPGDRQRFTLAHETGHAVMHKDPAEGQEGQADRFAAELLMPANDIRDELTDPTLERLLALKSRWRVSAAALLRRCYDLGLVNDYGYRRLNTEMSAAGWRTAEPAPVAAEMPHALAAALVAVRRLHSDADIARRVMLLEPQLDRMFKVGGPSE